MPQGNAHRSTNPILRLLGTNFADEPKNCETPVPKQILDELWLACDTSGRKATNQSSGRDEFIENQRANKVNVATLLYGASLLFFLIRAVTTAWSDISKNGAEHINGDAIFAFIINTLIQFVGHAFLSPLGIICLALYIFYYEKHKKPKNPVGKRPEKTLNVAAFEPETTNANTSAVSKSTSKNALPGLRIAAIFLIVNAILTFLITAFLQGGALNAFTTNTLYRAMFFGDIICALALLSGRDIWRWYVIARIIYGVLYWVVWSPFKLGVLVDWQSALLQLMFLMGMLALVLIKSGARLQKRFAVAAVIIALISSTSVNYFRYNQYQETKKSLLSTMPWLTPEFLDLFLKDVESKRLNESQLLTYFTAMLDKGNQQLSAEERKEITQIYGIAYASLQENDATNYMALAQKYRQRQPLSDAESDKLMELTTKALSGLKDPYKTRFQQLNVKEYEAAKSQQ